MIQKIGKNFRIAYLYTKRIKSKKAVLFIENPAFNPETGESDLLDVFVYDKRYNVFDWIYGLADPEDEKVGISKYNFEWIISFTDKYFKNYSKYFISMTKKDFENIKWLNIQSVNIDDLKEHEILSVSAEKDDQMKKKIFDIYLFKLQQFLNFMDTLSIPLYFKNIAVKENELGNHKRALFNLKLALKKSKDQEIRNELFITLLKLEKYKLLDRITSDETDSVIELQTRAFALKMIGRFKSSLTLYKRIFKKNKEDWVKNDIRWLEDELQKNI